MSTAVALCSSSSSSSSMGASFSTTRKRKSPESSPPNAHEQAVQQQPKKLKLVAKATTEMVDDYQVFLSFRGPDTRYDFTDVLYQHMDSVGIRVFRDDDEIQVGQPIDVILQAIENSEICVPILSESFASSAWCLREVEKMVELEKKVMPIFYKIRADDVKLKTDLYKKAMEEHETKYGKEQVEKWKSALKKIAKIKGMGVSAKTSYITEFYKKFVDNVLGELPPRRRCESDYLVGMDSRVESIMELLDIGSHDRKYVVIHGMSGIGKTTLANFIFNKLLTKFDNACFLEDVRESSCSDLQQKLLEGLNSKSIVQSNLSRDIKERFYKKKVLIVLDDVKEWEQIEKLVGKSNWFGAGSRIIVTARNKDVLNTVALHEDKVLSFEMKTLVSEEAEALFCWYAFGKNNPSVGFESLSREIVQGAEGLPLSLKVTGAFLYKQDEEVWRDEISRQKKLPIEKVEERLRVSYNALNEDQRKIFLDIACLNSIANDRSKAVYMWKACELYPHRELRVLSSMSLIRVDDHSIWMHSQLKYLGKKIVREENKDPSKRSRLWVHMEAINVLRSMEGKQNLEVLQIEDGKGVTLSNEHFASCRELRFLQLAGANITGDFKNLLPNLKWFSWKYCPAILSATNLSMKNLVNLDLSRSFIDESWGGWKLIQDLNHLKDLDLSDCASLTITPKFCKNNSLERLVLSNCSKLREIDGSIGKLEKLKYLDLYNCDSLGGLPDEIGCLVKLETLMVNGSSRAHVNLRNSIGCLKALTSLELVGFSVSDIPESIGGLAKLQYLHLNTCAEVLPESLGDLQSLVNLNLEITSEYCKLPKSLGRLVKLEELYVSGGMNFDELLESLANLKELKTLSLPNGIVKKIPASIGKLKKLENIDLGCVLEEVTTELCNLPRLIELIMWSSSISTLPDLPLSLRRLRVSSRSLRKVANLSRLVNLEYLELLGVDDYGWSKEIPDDSNWFEGGIEKLIKLEELHLGIATTKKILQFDLGSLPFLKQFTLDFQPDLEESDVRPLLLQSASSSSSCPHDLDFTSQGSRLGLKLPNLSSLKNVSTVELNNCLLKDGLESLGIQHMENVNKVVIINCSAELIELACLIKNLSALQLYCCGSFKTLPNLSRSKNLETLTIYNCKDVVEITCLEKLSKMLLYDCPKLKTIEGIEGLFLSELRLQNCGSSKTLPDLSKLKNLTALRIESCKEVVEITGLGSLVSLRKLNISDCKSLERLENLSKLENLSFIILRDCPKLKTIEGIEGLLLSWLVILGCVSLQNRDELKKRCKKKAHINMD